MNAAITPLQLRLAAQALYPDSSLCVTVDMWHHRHGGKGNDAAEVKLVVFAPNSTQQITHSLYGRNCAAVLTQLQALATPLIADISADEIETANTDGASQ